MDTQLCFDDDLPPLDDGGEEIELGPMQRLGETLEYGYLLLQLLELAGWDVVVTKPFAGVDEELQTGGVLVIANNGTFEVKRVGESVAAIASDLFQEAMRLPRPRTPAGVGATA